MAKVRVYQLAKDLNVQSALILELLDRMGQEVRSDLSTLDQKTAELVSMRIKSAIAAERQRVAVQERQQPMPPAEAAAPVASEPSAGQAEETPAPAEPAVHAPAAEETAVPAAAAPADKPAARKSPARPESPAAAAAATSAIAGTTARKPRVFPARRVPPTSTLRPKPSPPPAARVAAGPTAPRPYGPPPGTVRRPAAAPVTPGKKRRKKEKKERQAVVVPTARVPKELPPVPAEITLSEGVTVKELAEKLNRKSKDVIAKLIPRGILATINQPLEPDVAIEVAKEFGAEARIITFEEEAQQVATPDLLGETEVADDTPDQLVPRPPVVTVMGHVDHGKTSLLDAVRETSVVDSEAGGITQHIGAYQVEARNRKITFLDTPGHEAFTMMRARGAKATDIVVLVVAADDGVKPQTLEAIDHARAADVPIVVAINKMDKPGANPARVKQQLADRNLLVEEYGGDIVSCEVSAKKRTGIDELLEMILLVADLKDLKANPNKPATGVVLEARLDRARGVLATV
ncbi:MAG TPA: translation initiation factor IF-2 N-terminal domain-containing protein, partial [Candidatus Polarisedimenticolaceae bacterium]|nr:translation initiation factor IF-2 N-terminal domain-containing protein [Candidatus Polarisedimenticolaceae bacterium]